MRTLYSDNSTEHHHAHQHAHAHQLNHEPQTGHGYGHDHDDANKRAQQRDAIEMAITRAHCLVN